MTPAKTLIEALALRDKEHVALVGAGGKTTTLFALSGLLKGLNKKVLLSTTTKMWCPMASQVESVRLTGLEASWREGLRRDLVEGRSVFLGLGTSESGKVQGVDPSLLDGLYKEEDLDYLLVEADGAAGRPVKAPSLKEPVIPRSATLVVACMGLEALGGFFTPEMVFRPEPFERLTRIAPGGIVTAGPLSRIFVHPEGLFRSAPGSARKVAFLNKADLDHDREGARELSLLILRDRAANVERVVVGSNRTGAWEVQAGC